MFFGRKENVHKVAKWLRRWTANPMFSTRVGSNPILVVNNTSLFYIEHSVRKSFCTDGNYPVFVVLMAQNISQNSISKVNTFFTLFTELE